MTIRYSAQELRSKLKAAGIDTPNSLTYNQLVYLATREGVVATQTTTTGGTGTVGPRGPQGVRGVQGTQGTQGATGPAGAQGAQGAQGATGPQGAAGAAGANGNDGAQGAQGPQGIAGADGADGVDGSQGPQGIQGPAGANGNDGADGADGAVGPQGPAGADGNDGAVGPVGPIGPQGPAGNDGADGNDGAVGPQGPTGATGAAGSDGSDGNDGATGPQGPIGLTGPAGADGADGADGATGPQGPTGSAGADGNDGAQGPAGSTGPQGPQGPTGPTGPAGADGADGSDGADGAQGPVGPQGPTGATGAQGATGSSGTGSLPTEVYDISSQQTNLSVGWWTFALVKGRDLNNAQRAMGQFFLADTSSGRHRACRIEVGHHYGRDGGNQINLLSVSGYGSGVPFTKFRLVEGNTYDGAAIQVYISNSTNRITAHIMFSLQTSSGWTLLNQWIPNADIAQHDVYLGFTTGSGNYVNWAVSMAAIEEIDLEDLTRPTGGGGMGTTGSFFAQKDFKASGVIESNDAGTLGFFGAQTVQLPPPPQFPTAPQLTGNSQVDIQNLADAYDELIMLLQQYGLIQ